MSSLHRIIQIKAEKEFMKKIQAYCTGKSYLKTYTARLVSFIDYNIMQHIILLQKFKVVAKISDFNFELLLLKLWKY